MFSFSYICICVLNTGRSFQIKFYLYFIKCVHCMSMSRYIYSRVSFFEVLLMAQINFFVERRYTYRNHSWIIIQTFLENTKWRRKFLMKIIKHAFTCLRFAFILFLDILKSLNLTNLQKLEFIYAPNNLFENKLYVPFLWSWGNKPLSISF